MISYRDPRREVLYQGLLDEAEVGDSTQEDDGWIDCSLNNARNLPWRTEGTRYLPQRWSCGGQHM